MKAFVWLCAQLLLLTYAATAQEITYSNARFQPVKAKVFHRFTLSRLYRVRTKSTLTLVVCSAMHDSVHVLVGGKLVKRLFAADIYTEADFARSIVSISKGKHQRNQEVLLLFLEQKRYLQLSTRTVFPLISIYLEPVAYNEASVEKSNRLFIIE